MIKKLLLVGLLASPGYGQDFSKGSVKWMMSPVKNQGNRDTCSVFAATALIEAERAYNNYDFSEQCLAAMSSNKDPGQTLKRLNYIQRADGLYQETECPYKEDTRGIPPYHYMGKPVPIKTRWDAWHANTINHENVRAAIMFYKPVAVSVYYAGDWRADIIEPPTGKEIKEECGTKEECPGHAVVIVGYDDDEQAFEFKNSWGPRYGRNGYGKMSYAYFNLMKKNYVISRKD